MPINNQRYSYESIRVTLSGRELAECAGIDYKQSEESEMTYVLGSKKPVASTNGKRSNEANIMLTQDQYAEIQKNIPRGASLLDIEPFEITVSYLDKDDRLMTDRLSECRFKEVAKDFKTDGPFGQMTLPLNVGDILYNV